MQSPIKQSSRSPIPSSTLHDCGSVPSDDAFRDDSAAGAGGLRRGFVAEEMGPMQFGFPILNVSTQYSKEPFKNNILIYLFVKHQTVTQVTI